MYTVNNRKNSIAKVFSRSCVCVFGKIGKKKIYEEQWIIDDYEFIIVRAKNKTSIANTHTEKKE
jgi:hypothetical protein